MARRSIYRKIDWLLVGIYLILILFGLMNIYSALRVDGGSLFDLHTRYGMDIIWIGASVITALVVLFIIPARSWSVLAWWGYLFV
ncbi:MAG: hypothetical protein HUJ90_00335, partial [Bacteroidales bacterium]|nr:hypothetical protein [Bacteroidales bacterium]